MTRRVLPVLVCAVLGSAVGCGGSGDEGSGGSRPTIEPRAELGGAGEPDAERFPAPRSGQTLRALSDSMGTGTEVRLATSVHTPGHNRIAFGLLDERDAFVYGPTVVYAARSPRSTDVIGPYLAPADSLVTDPAFRSRQAATEDDPFAAVYQADGVELDEPGTWSLLAVTDVGGRLVAASTEVRVRRDTPIPARGDRAPVVDTDTVTSAGGVEAVDTRRPPARELHETNFRDAVGRKPVALLFATPQLCRSRVCGPVVDIALQLKQKYGDRVAFIHQEVYVDNDPAAGLRAPLRRFGLTTEPWLFAIDERGRVAWRLEGSFGLEAFDKAVQLAVVGR
jgi:hypothetical protein